MIVRRHQAHWLLITQPDHAALSAAIMAGWTADGLPAHPRREVILLATREHDAGWAEVDVAPIVDATTGQLLDFVHAPDATRQGVWPRSVARLASEPYAAALVAQHALHVYRDNRSQAAWAPFFARIDALRDEQLAKTGYSLETLTADYQFVRLGDLVSLFFANHWPGPRVEAGYTVRVAAEQVIVSPDPFSGTRIPFTLTGRLMPARRYADQDEATRAFTNASMVTLHGTASGS